MAINLSKGQKIDLTKTNPGLKNVVIGLGWDTKKFDGGTDFDLDASSFILNAQGKCNSESDFIFYNNPANPNQSVKYLGDNRSGIGEGDDEQIEISLDAVPATVDKISFTITIYDAEIRRQNFGQVSNAYARIYNKDTGVDLINYDLDEDFSIETAIIVGELYRHGAEWKFSAVGAGYQGGLASLVKEYGLE